MDIAEIKTVEVQCSNCLDDAVYIVKLKKIHIVLCHSCLEELLMHMYQYLKV